ncbi:hypothetical protein KUL25_01515 [Rhodobacteraceae bacterium N5(2021)]|uniref:Uncharacterized protein n=1 Tax=Gymnodinialimonas phycosphaerae TaxID=2841589 RepID=A0A975TV12_9RHOB|nr:hypothetical protein [Gymnodinialimonas phycosphaerae]MBY4891437.1 hypothetical protein [Gymnodinialimonas phycosphaerae]
MKRTLPLLAVLAATLAAPVAAQDISSILNPGNFAARLNTGANPAMANLPSDMSGLFQGPNAAARLNPALAGQVAALAPVVRPEVRSLAPLTSIAPVPRGMIARIVVPTAEAAPTIAHGTPERGTDLVAAMADAAEAAPAGATTLVINGSNTAVIQSGPGTAEAPRLSLWQRLFGI